MLHMWTSFVASSDMKKKKVNNNECGRYPRVQAFPPKIPRQEVERGCTNFPKNYQLSSHNSRRHCTKFSHPGYVTSALCALLGQGLLRLNKFLEILYYTRNASSLQLFTLHACFVNMPVGCHVLHCRRSRKGRSRLREYYHVRCMPVKCVKFFVAPVAVLC